jgi:hypothetical protein
MLCVVLAGCASIGQEVDSEVTQGVSPLPVETFSLQIENMPGFLVPYFRDELVGVLAKAGASEVAGQADVAFTLRYVQVDLAEPEALPDELGERVGSEDPARFIARVEVEARRPGSSNPVFAAVLSRVHQVTVGAYMHERARLAIRRALARVLGVTL